MFGFTRCDSASRMLPVQLSSQVATTVRLPVDTVFDFIELQEKELCEVGNRKVGNGVNVGK